MKRITMALAVLLFSIQAHAEERRGSDLTYCLELPTAQLIAKCSGERAGGGKSATMSRAEVDKLLASLPPPAAKPVTESQPAEAKPEAPAESNTEEIKPE